MSWVCLPQGMLRAWAVSWVTNYVGTLLIIGLVVWGGTHDGHLASLATPVARVNIGFG